MDPDHQLAPRNIYLQELAAHEALREAVARREGVVEAVPIRGLNPLAQRIIAECLEGQVALSQDARYILAADAVRRVNEALQNSLSRTHRLGGPKTPLP